jgi:hypothetical protein
MGEPASRISGDCDAQQDTALMKDRSGCASAVTPVSGKHD